MEHELQTFAGCEDTEETEYSPVIKKASVRRKRDICHKKRLMRKAEQNRSWLYGPYYDKKRQRVVIYGRGSRSKYLKRVSNKRVRKSPELYQRGQYKKVFDYWWEMD